VVNRYALRGVVVCVLTYDGLIRVDRSSADECIHAGRSGRVALFEIHIAQGAQRLQPVAGIFDDAL
jgi:hypothetical protein